jgi:hypothetical protein
VGFRASEIEERCAPHGALDDTQVDLHPFRGHRRRPGDSSGQDAGHQGQADEAVHHRPGIVGGDEQVDVAHRVSHAAQRPGVGGPANLRYTAEATAANICVVVGEHRLLMSGASEDAINGLRRTVTEAAKTTLGEWFDAHQMALAPARSCPAGPRQTSPNATRRTSSWSPREE